MVRSFGGIGRILAQTWPALLAWYLAGAVVRASVIALAAPIGPDNPLGALLLVPIAVLAQLVSYIGMFLVLRRALPGYRSQARGDVEFGGFRETVSEFVGVLLATIGPFFTLYAVIGLLSQDLSDYARAAFRYAMDDPGRGFVVGASPLAFAVVVVAFVLRLLLKVLGRRLPRWVAIIEIYLEATWVFVALTAINSLFGPLTKWINNRQVVQWWEGAREYLSSLWAPIRFAFESIDWATPVALQLLILPLAWLLVAGIIYLRALGTVDEAAPLPERLTRRVGGLRIAPGLLRYRHLITGTWDEVGKPIVASARMVIGAGIRNLAIFLAAYGLLFAAGQWALRGIYTLVGAHDLAFWWIADAGISGFLAAVVEPIRILLLAAAFDYCLRRWAERRALVPEAPSPVSAPERIGTSHPSA